MSFRQKTGEQEVFFVTGLPRSRTTWLANYLTYGQIWCHHDLLLRTPHMEWFDDALRRPFARVTGDSDSGLPLAYERLNQWYPKAKWIVVIRDQKAALKSYIHYFRAHPYQRQGPLNVEQVEAAYRLLDNRLSSLLVHPQISQRTLVVLFENLESSDTAWRILEFLGANAVRGVPERIWRQRWKELNNMTLNPASKKIGFNAEWSGKWVQEALNAA